MPTRLNPTKDGFFQRKPKGTWWTRFEGVPQSTGCTDLAAARLWRAEREREAASPAYRASRNRTLMEGISAYLQSLESAGRVPASIEYVTNKLLPWVRHLGKDFVLGDLTAEVVASCLKQQSERASASNGVKPSPNTLAKNLSALLSMLRVCRHLGWIEIDPKILAPIHGVGARHVKLLRVLSVREVRVLLGLDEDPDVAPLPRERAVWLALAVATAGRLSEVNALRRSMIGKDVILLPVGKTRKVEGAVRLIPIVNVNRWLVEFALAHGNDGEELSPPMQKTDLSNLSRRGGRTRFSANDVRRTLPTWAVQAGIPDRVVAKLMGHQTTAMVQRHYTELGVEDLRSALGTLEGHGKETDSFSAARPGRFELPTTGSVDQPHGEVNNKIPSFSADRESMFSMNGFQDHSRGTPEGHGIGIDMACSNVAVRAALVGDQETCHESLRVWAWLIDRGQ